MSRSEELNNAKYLKFWEITLLVAALQTVPFTMIEVGDK